MQIKKNVKNADNYSVISRRLRCYKYFYLVVFFLLNTALAFAGPTTTTYQARIVKPDGLPLESANVHFRFSILDPVGTCILYTENYSNVSMASTSGLISFSLGSGIKTFPVSGTTFEQVFSNITPFMACDAGGPANYSPGANDIRKIVMQFNDGAGWQTLPAMSINAVPYAMYANNSQTLAGKQASEFVQVTTLPSCGASEAMRYNGSSFSCINVGSGGGGGSVTSASVIAALGYTPADTVSFTTQSSSISSVSSTVSSLSSTVSGLSSTVSGLSASMAALTSSQWITSGTTISYSAGNVYIGTSFSPTAKLHVRQSASASTIASFDKNDGVEHVGLGVYGYLDSDATAYMRDTVMLYADSQTTNLQLSAAGASGTIRFTTKGWSTSATERMRIDSNGNVGIGTSTPVVSLDVGGWAEAPTGLSTGANITGNLYVGNTGSGVARTRLSSNVGGGFLQWNRILTASGVVQTDPTKSSFNFEMSGSTDRFIFSRSASGSTTLSELMTLTGTGNLGIGTATPAARLDVSGGVRIGADATSCSSVNAGTLRYNSGVVEYCNGTTWTEFGVSGAGIMALNGLTSGSQTFALGTAGLTANVSSTGSVHTFNVPLAASAGVTAGLLSNADYTIFVNSLTNFTVSFATVSAQQAANAASFTTTTANIAAVSSAVSALSSNAAASFAAITSSQWSTVTSGIHYSAGNVGIGLSTPSYALDISGTAQITNGGRSIYFNQGSQYITPNNGTWANFTQYNGYSGSMLSQFGSLGVSNTLNYAYISVTSASPWLNPAVVVLPSGNVGIGTTTPGAALDVRNTASGSNTVFHVFSPNLVSGTYNQMRLGMLASANNSAELRFHNVGGSGSAANFGALALYGQAIPSISFNGAGNVGIGTSVPVTRLEVSGGIKISMEAAACAASYAGSLRYNSGNLELCNGTTWSAFTTSSGDTSVITNTGGNIVLVPANSVVVSSTAASTNSSTGALVVQGGVGVAGALNVAGTVSSSGRVKALGFRANQGAPDAADSSTNGYAFGDDGDTGIFSPGSGGANGILAFYTNNAERMRMLSSGYVGIGTSAPTNTLQVSGTTHTVGLTVAGAYSTSGTSTARDATIYLGSYQFGRVQQSLLYDGGGWSNYFIGYGSGNGTNTGTFNMGFGSHALGDLTTGGSNVAMGYGALGEVLTGSNNVAVGRGSLTHLRSGSSNVAFGYGAGQYVGPSGSTPASGTQSSVAIGHQTRFSADSTTNEIVIGSQAVGAGSNSVMLGSSAITKTVLNGSVGIATSAPVHALDLQGAIADFGMTRTVNSAAGPDIYLQKDRGSVGAPSIINNNDALGNISFRGYDGSAYRRGAYIQARATASASAGQMTADMFFYTNNGAADASERMRLTASGSLGIGATQVTNTLTVSNTQVFNPSSNVSSAIMVGPPTGQSFGGGILMKDMTYYTGMWASDNGASLRLGAGGAVSGFPSVKTLVVTSQAVGVNTETPTERLEVNGNLKVTGEIYGQKSWGTKKGPMSFSANYINVWNAGYHVGTSIDCTSSTTGCTILKSGTYEIRCVQRAANTNSVYVGIALSGDRTVLETRTDAMWSHDHSTSAGSFTESNFIGTLSAGNFVTCGAPVNTMVPDLTYGTPSYNGNIVIKRID